jgi:hypothetical protein
MPNTVNTVGDIAVPRKAKGDNGVSDHKAGPIRHGKTLRPDGASIRCHTHAPSLTVIVSRLRRYRCRPATRPQKQGAQGRIKLTQNSTPSEPAGRQGRESLKWCCFALFPSWDHRGDPRSKHSRLGRPSLIAPVLGCWAGHRTTQTGDSE